MQNTDISLKYLSFLTVIFYVISYKDGKSHEDILKEVKTEGFLVDLEEILGRVKRETFPLNDTEVPKTVLPDVDMKPSTVATLDTKGPTNKPSFAKSSSSVFPSVFFSDTEGSGSASEIEPSQFTTRSITIEPAKGKPIETPVEKEKGRMLNNFEGECPHKILLYIVCLRVTINQSKLQLYISQLQFYFT